MTEYTNYEQLYKDLLECYRARFMTGYAIEHEDYVFNTQHSAPQKKIWLQQLSEYQWEPPKEIDPRPWFDIHDQGPVGSCQGNALADCLEYTWLVEQGEEIQLSRAFAFMSSQEFDGLLGQDTGSTLAGGTKAASRGIPLESDFDYTPSYRGQLSEYRSRKDSILSGTLYKFQGAIDLTSEPECFNFLSSWAGAIQIGIAWNVADTWEITRYSAGGGGGHSVLICGYLKRVGWPNDRGYLLKNSWGPRWGKDGWGLVHPDVLSKMINGQWAEFIGRSKSVAPAPRRDNLEHVQHHLAVSL